MHKHKPSIRSYLNITGCYKTSMNTLTIMLHIYTTLTGVSVKQSSIFYELYEYRGIMEVGYMKLESSK